MTEANQHELPAQVAMHTGAFISLVSCSMIVVLYTFQRKWRRHPNSLLFWKSLVDMAFAFRFQYPWDAFVSVNGCRVLASMTHFCTISSECWFLSMSLDLYRCSTNPFINVQQSLQLYHFFAWTAGFTFALLVWYSGIDFNHTESPLLLSDTSACYMSEQDTTLQLLNYALVVFSVLVAVGFSVLENQNDLRGGMKQAREAKKNVIRSARIFTLAYIIYQILVISLWVAKMVAHDANFHHHYGIHSASWFIQTSRGSIDLIIWISMNGFPLWWRSSTQELDESSEGLSTDIDVEMEPQLNLALRQEVLHFTTRGIIAACTNMSEQKNRTTVAHLRLHELGMIVLFNDYYPEVFRDIRHGFGIDEDIYRRSFSSTCHERIQSGGSSGAFMFYTADYLYLVKTVTREERQVLFHMLPRYVQHMRTHPGSHLTRYYGCHAIEMYGQWFSFVVMGNAIGRVSMHQFYDIKGSWINRNAKPIPPGKIEICTYCSHAFKHGSHETCPYSIHGYHVPHVILKDNDFHHRLRVPPSTVTTLLQQLDEDTVFLEKEGIMDYSLLLSLHCTKYVVDHTSVDMVRLAGEATKRKVHYAMCHPEYPNAIGQESGSPQHRVQVQVLDPNGERRLTRSVRQFRHSVLTKDDEATGLTTPSEEMPLTSLCVDPSKWIGIRPLEKEGYHASAVVGPDYYTIGVVDILQTWTWRKRIERLWKTIFLRRDPKGISAAPPTLYAKRFQRKMREILMVPNHFIGYGSTSVDR